MLLPLTYTAPADARPGDTLALSAAASWLVCKEVCIPESATLTLSIPVSATSTERSAHAPLFDRAQAEQAVPMQGWTAAAQLAGRDLQVTLTAPPGPAAPRPAVHLFPYAEQLIEPAAHAVYRTDDGYALRLKLLEGAAPPRRCRASSLRRPRQPRAARPSGAGSDARWSSIRRCAR